MTYQLWLGVPIATNEVNWRVLTVQATWASCLLRVFPIHHLTFLFEKVGLSPNKELILFHKI